jgi:beta-lactamase regulating signal transducer with metallopeptidase domain
MEIRLSDALDAPSVVGFLHPAVLLPRALWSELEPGDLKQILMHEKAHLDRGDDWTNLLQKLLRAVCPLNPALLWAERQLCMEREQACDDAVLDAAGNPRAYATCLTKLAETRLVKRAAALAPGMWKRHSELAGRVNNILHRKPGARFQQASFHVAPKPLAVRQHPARKSATAPQLRFIALPSMDGSGAMTFVVFTVEAPRSSTAHPLPTHNTWIIFQI